MDTKFEYFKRVPLAPLIAGASGAAYVIQSAHDIEDWPDHQFQTEDGRKFGLFLDGETILKRLDAKDVMINWKDEIGIAEIKYMPGFIVEIDTDDPAFTAASKEELIYTWANLHMQFHVVPTEQDIALGFPDWSDEDYKRGFADEDGD